MKYFSILAILLVVASSARASGDERFIEWWKNFDDQVQVRESGLDYGKKSETRLNALPEYQGALTVPKRIPGEIEKVLEVYSQKNFTILLVLPKNMMKDMTRLNEEFKQEMQKCAGDRSWIAVLPQNVWTQIQLNPYCTMDYDPEQVTVQQYWTGSSSRPYIDIGTGSLTCTPHYLYGWDKITRAYILKAEKCTGARRVENYSVNSLLRQLF